MSCNGWAPWNKSVIQVIQVLGQKLQLRMIILKLRASFSVMRVSASTIRSFCRT